MARNKALHGLRCRAVVLVRNAVYVSTIATVGAGCTEQVYATTPVVEGPAAVDSDVDVVDVPAPPVAEIETYPAATYQGVNVYYVDGRWYRRGPRGWAFYRQEPPPLASHRQEHWEREHDPRWAPRPAPPARVEEPRVAPPRQGMGVTEVQPSERRVQPEPPRRETVPPPQARPPAPAPASPPPPRGRGTPQVPPHTVPPPAHEHDHR